MSKNTKAALLVSAFAAVLVGTLYGIRRSGATQTTGDVAALSSITQPDTRLTLDPKLFQGPARQAYEIAEKDPALLAQLHCYCGCDRTDGHKNLLDCYRDNHGSHCAICTGEAIEAEKLADQGMPVEKIRDALRDRFANGE